MQKAPVVRYQANSSTLKRGLAPNVVAPPARGRLNASSMLETFPSSLAMEESNTWVEIIEQVKSTRANATRRRHNSLRVEIAWTYGLGHHFAQHHGHFLVFCKIRNISVKKKITSNYILQQVFLEYAGRDDAGKKEASRFKNLIMPSFREGLSVTQLLARIGEVGGVHKLVTKTKRKPKRAAAITIRNSSEDMSLSVSGAARASCVVAVPTNINVQLKPSVVGHRVFDILIVERPSPKGAASGLHVVESDDPLVAVFAKLFPKVSIQRRKADVARDVSLDDATSGADGAIFTHDVTGGG